MTESTPAATPHDRTRKSEEEEEEDPVIQMISKTGCLELHYAVQVQLFLFLIYEYYSVFKIECAEYIIVYVWLVIFFQIEQIYFVIIFSYL